MSDFITNLTGVPETGIYNSKGTPSGSRNDGGMYTAAGPYSFPDPRRGGRLGRLPTSPMGNPRYPYTRQTGENVGPTITGIKGTGGWPFSGPVRLGTGLYVKPTGYGTTHPRVPRIGGQIETLRRTQIFSPQEKYRSIPRWSTTTDGDGAFSPGSEVSGEGSRYDHYRQQFSRTGTPSTKGIFNIQQESDVAPGKSASEDPYPGTGVENKREGYTRFITNQGGNIVSTPREPFLFETYNHAEVIEGNKGQYGDSMLAGGTGSQHMIGETQRQYPNGPCNRQNPSRTESPTAVTGEACGTGTLDVTFDVQLNVYQGVGTTRTDDNGDYIPSCGYQNSVGTQVSGYWIHMPVAAENLTQQQIEEIGQDPHEGGTIWEHPTTTKGPITYPGPKGGDDPQMPGSTLNPCWPDYPDGGCECKQAMIGNGTSAPFNSGLAGSGTGLIGKLWAHKLLYVGESLSDIKNVNWCNWKGHGSLAEGLNASGLTEWFYEGMSCNPDGTTNTSHSGKLYACYCDIPEIPRNAGPRKFTPKITTLTKVSTIIAGSKDDPCDCNRRIKKDGGEYKDHWDSAQAKEDKNWAVFVTGCSSLQAKLKALGDGSYPPPGPIWVMRTGGIVDTPGWNSDDCSWSYPMQRAVVCENISDKMEVPQPPITGSDGSPLNFELVSDFYCASGEQVTIQDRNLWPADDIGLVNYYACDEFGCVDPEPVPTGDGCVSGANKFDIGDYVNIASSQLSGILMVGGVSAEVQTLDLSVDGAGGTGISSGFWRGRGAHPFITGGCTTDTAVFQFNIQPEQDEYGNDIDCPCPGTWELINGSGCCGEGSGVFPDPNYTGEQGDTSGIPCGSFGSGLDVLTNAWKVVDTGYFQQGGLVSNTDCIWGYVVEFTGCAPSGADWGGGNTPYLTGTVPADYHGGGGFFIPESQLSSGTGCA